MDRERGSKHGMRLAGSVLVGAMLVAQSGCRTVEMTGRRQLLLVPETNEIQMGVTAFQETLTSEKPSQNQQYVQMVERVGGRIAQVANRPDYQWEFKVIESSTMNAFCLPGGKVAIYEGMIPVCQSEAGLAVVMSHEIAHALARHGGERMSQGYVVNGVGTAVDKVLQRNEVTHRDKILQAYGVASEYGVILPYSRKHESEADKMGLMLMARAGYDPGEAPRFWQRFGSTKGEQPMEFMSTHPADERRARELFELLPEAMVLYQQAPTKYGLGEPVQVATAAPASSGLPPANGATAPPNGAAASLTPMQKKGPTSAANSLARSATPRANGQIARASFQQPAASPPPPLPPAQGAMAALAGVDERAIQQPPLMHEITDSANRMTGRIPADVAEDGESAVVPAHGTMDDDGLVNPLR